MKKIIYLLIVLFVALSACQKKIVPGKSRWTPIVIGEADAGEGESLYSAFNKINGFADEMLDSLGNIYTESQTDQAIVTYVDDIIATASIGVALADSDIVENGYLSGFDSKTVGVRQSDLPIGQSDIINKVYYVSNDGNDDNEGLSTGSSWAHHPWMSTWTGSVTLEPGDVVLMKRGDTWTIASPGGNGYMTVAQSGTSHNYIVTSAYGIGAKPIINISTDTDVRVIFAEGKSWIILDNLDISHFSKERALTGQYGLFAYKNVGGDVPHDWIITNCDIHDIPQTGICFWGDAYNIVVGDTTATITATDKAYSNHIYDCGYAGVQLDGRNPTTDISNFKVYKNYIHDIDYAGTTDRDEYGIAFTAEDEGTGQWESDGWPAYIYACFNRIADIPIWHGIDAHGVGYGWITDNYIEGCRMGIIAFAADRVDQPEAICDHVYIERNEIVRTGTEEAYFKGIQVCAENADLRATNIWITDNEIYYSPRAADGSAMCVQVFLVDGCIISGNYFHDGPTGTSGGAIQIQATGGDLQTKNITIEDNISINWDSFIDLYTADIDGDITVRNNIAHSMGDCIWFATSETLDAGVISLYNNTLMSDHNASSRYPIRFGASSVIGAAAEVLIKNNIIAYSTNTAAGLYLQGPATLTGTLEIDYNQYFDSTYATPFSIETVAKNLADWNTAGYDGNSPNVGHGDADFDPLFKNAGGSYLLELDFDLQTTSPCIDAGVDVGIDFLGTAPDISREKR